MKLKKALHCLCLVFFLIKIIGGEYMVYALSPADISGEKVFFYDAQNIDGDNTSSNNPVNSSLVSSWKDTFLNHTGSQIDTLQRPFFVLKKIFSFPALFFNGTGSMLEVEDSAKINTGTGYTKKSFGFVFKTGPNINTLQTIYEQGGKEKGFAFQIESGKLYGGVYNTFDWGSGSTSKIIDYGNIAADTVYTLFFVYDSSQNLIRGYLDGELKSSLTGIQAQKGHGVCKFDTDFNCSLYDSGGSIGIGGTKNDTFRLSNTSQISLFEGNFFQGYLGEMLSWNTSLTSNEVAGLQEYFVSKWGIDTIAPTVTGTNFGSGVLLPGGNHTIQFLYNDSHTGSVGIDTTSFDITLTKWNGTGWSSNLANTGIITNSINTTMNTASFPLNNLTYGKYKMSFRIADKNENISDLKELTFYIDTPEFTINTSTINIGDIYAGNEKMSDEVTVTVKTLGAGIRVFAERENNLTYGTGDILPVWNGNEGWGYKNTPYSGNLQGIGTDTLLASQSSSINTAGEQNITTFKIKLGSLISAQQIAGNYTGTIKLKVGFTYEKE